MEKSKIDYKLLKEFLSKCVLTGSRAFGVASEDSDWDYICRYDIFHEFFPHSNFPIFYDSRYNDDDKFQSFKMELNEKKYNFIILYEELEFKVWKRSGKAILKLPKIIILDKISRVELFETIKNAYRCALN